ncbi:efflux transporter outer membrane subunit [uncultured Thiodictyon sp.]|uniref:efflux transporter outer membrane subunit n=1 Tax=uncultured Thiodictyon sp. TaxID=1846217 RepID=UPI0025DA1DE3|nr:efflux transporter outer membrane subunit [uncultured Thiodictyon sp.]
MSELRPRLLALMALTALVSGCMFGPDYARPRVDTPATYRFALRDAQNTANTQWWRQFNDPILDDLIIQSLGANWNVKIAAANVEAAAAVLTQARAPLYPQLNYNGQGARAQTAAIGALPASARDNFQLLAGASWEIDLWGRIRRQTEAARAQLLGTEEARRGVVLSLVGAVANGYIQLRGLDAQLAMSKQTQAAYGESLRLIEYQFKYGQVSEMTVAQARSQYETASAQIPLLERSIAQTENGLSTLLGRNPGPIARGHTLETLVPPSVPTGVPSDLLERRPDVLQAEQQLIAANAQIGAARALYFPTISLTGALGTNSSQLSGLFTGPARTWSYAGAFAGPLFTAGSISGQVAQTEAQQRAALGNYQQVIQGAFADVSNALVAREKLNEEVLALQRLVKALGDYSRLAKLQYAGGYAPYSTVLQADQQLFPAELNLAATRASALSAVVSIYQAMGGGWVDEAAQAAPAPQPGKGPFAPAIPRAPGAVTTAGENAAP